MSPLDRRVGQLMVRLRLARRAATRQALLETTGQPEPSGTTGRRSDYHLTA